MKLFPGRQTRQEYRHRGSRKGYSETIVRTVGGEGDA